MSSSRSAGPLGLGASPFIDQGTLVRASMFAPGPLGASPVPRSYNYSTAQGFEPGGLHMSPEGVQWLKTVEHLALTPYDDQTGKPISQWVKGATIGYGHLITAGEWSTYANGIDQTAADALFASDLAPFEQAVRDAITVRLQQYQFDALVIFAFNIGARGFRTSSVVRLINNPQATTPYASLEAAWMAWSKSQGKVMKGLQNRRRAEWAIYTRAVYAHW
jgi:GH24 family phage-related lysozyme (muramidase)